MIMDALGKGGPQFRAVPLAGELLVPFLKLRAELQIALFAARKAHHLELRGQIARSREIVQRRDEFAVGQIARGTKNHHGAGFRALACDEGVEERIFGGVGHG